MMTKKVDKYANENKENFPAINSRPHLSIEGLMKADSGIKRPFKLISGEKEIN